MSRTNGGEGRTESPCDAAERCSAGGRGYSLLGVACGSSYAAGAAEHSVDPPVPLRRLPSKTWRATVGRTQADPGLCSKGFEWQAAFIEMPADEPRSRLMVSSGQRVLCMVCEVLDGGGHSTLEDLTPLVKLNNVVGLQI